MASPVGHALVGIGLAALAVPVLDLSPTPALWLGAVVASGVPDLDLLGVLLGYKLKQVHRRATHSLLVLGMLALALLWASPWLSALPFLGSLTRAHTGVWALALLAHPVVDLVTTRVRPNHTNWGIPLFWPLSARRWALRRPLVRPPSLASYATSALWRDLLPELCLFVPTCVTLVVLGQVL